MRIVIDLQGGQSDSSRNRGIGRYSLSLAKAIINNRGEHEIIVVLNSLFPQAANAIYEEFSKIMPAQNIVTWHASGSVAYVVEGSKRRRELAQYSREIFLANLNADMILVLSLFEGFIDNAVTSISQIRDIPTAVILYDLIPLIYADIYLEGAEIKAWYLEKIESLKRAEMLLSISHSAREEALEYLYTPQEKVVNISTAADDHFFIKDITLLDEKHIKNSYKIDKSFVMYTGGIDHRKNIEGLIRAYALLPQEIREKHQLAIVCHLSDENMIRLSQLLKDENITEDEVIFTGYIPDDDLVTLYNMCDLFVFPSWHEGFGLPALEAMLCGAVVIGSDRSSLPEVIGLEEALFDPMDDHSIADKLLEGLRDEAFRQRLREHAKEQTKKFSWDISAKLALGAIEERVVERQSLQKESEKPRSKPSLAYLSPLPPQRSGISDYSADLLPLLSEYYEIDAIVEDIDIVESSIKHCSTIRSIGWFREHSEYYDRVLYHFGNSHFHQHMFALLREIPGVVVLHDFFLSGIVSYMAQSEDNPQWWIENLYRSQGYRALHEYCTNPHRVGDMIHKYPVNLSVLQDAISVIVHSQNSISLRNRWYGQTSREWGVIPLLRMPSQSFDAAQAKLDLGLPKDALVISSFGIIDPQKLNHRLVTSLLNSSLVDDNNLYLIFVGESHNSAYEDEIRAIYKERDIECHIIITGWIEANLFQKYLEATDIGVQLRTNSKGESSASVLDCMNYGIATIVNANGTMADLPQDSVMSLPDKFVDDELIEALEILYEDKKLREVLGTKAREVVLQQHNPSYCSKRYIDTIEDIYAHKKENALLIVESIRRRMGDLSEQELYQITNDIKNNFPLEPRVKKIFIDISILSSDRHSEVSKRSFLSMLSKLLQSPIEGYHIEPVYISEQSEAYHYARAFTTDLLGISSTYLSDEVVEWGAGDIFVGSSMDELASRYLSMIEYMHSIGAYVSFILYEDLLIPDENHKEWLETIAKLDKLFTRSRAKSDEIQQKLRDYGIETEWSLESVQIQKLMAIIRYHALDKKISWRVEGPFDSSYSLALINREFAIALENVGQVVALHSTEGPGDFLPNMQFLQKHPELERLYQKSTKTLQESVSVTSRNIYPPRVKDMKSPFNFMHNYAWEESRFPSEWVQDFNAYLQGLMVTSKYVQKIMIDNGVNIPIAVTSNGVDHWERVVAESNYRVDDDGLFRFLHVSSCFPRKGVDLLLKSYARSFTINDPVVLVIKTFANPHNEIDRWIEEAKELCEAFPRVVVIEDDLSDSQLKSLYQLCDVYVGPSRAEGFGLPFAEAMLSYLPVITTGWGGQMDFCSDETAWLVDYKFAQAKTHFDLSDSVWAEPDEHHLSELMREVYMLPLEKLKQKAQVARDLLLENYRWSAVAQRSVESARVFSQVERDIKPKIGWISSWGTKCGIAAYSKHLLDNMALDITLLASYTDELVSQDESYVYRCWEAESDSFEKVDRVLDRLDIDTIVLQFNYGFYDFHHLYNFLFKQFGMGRTVVIMMHSTTDPDHIHFKDLQILLPALEFVDRILVHSISDLNNLKEHGLVDNVTLLAHGIVEYIPKAHLQNRSFTLGSYGFFLPHKGLLELIDTIAIMRDRGRDVRLKMLNAKYPVAVSQQLVDEASKKIEKLGLSKHIELVSDFLSDDDSLGRLGACDLLLFPYQETAESSSASVRYGLATGVPVAVTPLNIFEDVEEATYRLSGFSPEEMAESIIELMDDIQNESEKAQKQTLRSAQWCEDHRYSNIGTRLSNMIESLVLNKRYNLIKS